eukprot:6268292-Amphidinium_carterae.1
MDSRYQVNVEGGEGGVAEGERELQQHVLDAGNLYCNKTGAEGKVFVHDREWLLLEVAGVCQLYL